MKDLFTTDKGRLSAYAFACGYKERVFYNKGHSVLDLALFMENTRYHVRGWYCGRHVMECFNTLAKARAYIAKEKAIARQNARLAL